MAALAGRLVTRVQSRRLDPPFKLLRLASSQVPVSPGDAEGSCAREAAHARSALPTAAVPGGPDPELYILIPLFLIKLTTGGRQAQGARESLTEKAGRLQGSCGPVL